MDINKVRSCPTAIFGALRPMRYGSYGRHAREPVAPLGKTCLAQKQIFIAMIDNRGNKIVLPDGRAPSKKIHVQLGGLLWRFELFVEVVHIAQLALIEHLEGCVARRRFE